MPKYILIIVIGLLLQSCIPLKDLKYLQETQDLELNELGYIDIKSPEYRLQMDDILTMDVNTRDPNFAKKYGDQFVRGGGTRDEISGLKINSDGNITIPRLPEIYAVGLTIDELEKKIEKTFVTNQKYKEGEININLQLFGINYTMLGEVRRPGLHVIRRSRLTIIEAIAQAGDFTTVADRKKVKLYRKYPEGTRVVELDLTKDAIMNTEFFHVQPNDQFIINPKVQKTIGFGTNFSGTITTLAGVLTALLSIIFIYQRF